MEQCAQQEHRFRLSGIGCTDTRLKDILEVPDDMNDTVVDGASEAENIGERSKTVAALQQAFYWGVSEPTVYPHGYAIHARCWEMVERFMKQLDLNGQLGTLTKILRQTWNTPKRDNSSRLKWPQDYELPGITSQGYLLWSWTDPIDIKAVQDLLTESSKRALSKEAAGPIANMGSSQDVKISNLPLDIKLLVLDCLLYHDIANLLEVLDWEIPNSYWRSRLPGHVFEIENLRLGQPFDWRFFFVGIEQLLKTSPGLLNRQRIYQRIEIIKHHFKNPVDYSTTGLNYS